jgi:acetate kinase
MKVLIINIGSTSFKYRLFSMQDESVLAEGRVERIGQAGSEFPDYAAAIARCMHEISGEGKVLACPAELSAIGFKAVHAGTLSGAQIVIENVLAAMERFSFFAPAHNPPYIAAMRAFLRELPKVPLVALFETAFFDGLDEAATTYAVPCVWREQWGVRRYGFHGASHRAASERAQELLGRYDLRHVSCHLGGSSSMAAIRDGVAIDTSFGMSPQSGLPQSNRVGDVDAFAVLFMMKKLGLSVDEMASILSNRSGLAGISGASGDVRDLSKAAANGDGRACLAVDVFVRAIRHYLGAFILELGGLDVLTFSGGIGENSAEIRSAVCRGLSAFGIELDEEWNRTVRRQGTISSDKSAVKVLILPADEEIVVARATAAAIAKQKRGSEADSSNVCAGQP